MLSMNLAVQPGIVPRLDTGFQPLVSANRVFRQAVQASPHAMPLTLAVERGDGIISRYDTMIFAPDAPEASANARYVERLVKTLLWARGGWKLYVGGSREIADALRAVYAPDGARAFDYAYMSSVFEHPFAVASCAVEDVPQPCRRSLTAGGHWHGCRIGLDLGASDRKVSAVIDGEAVYSEEVVWDPRPQSDPQYHFDEIMTALRTAASHLPRVDAIGVSSAGVYINNRVMNASLFRGVPEELFNSRVKDLFLEIRRAWNDVPLMVINDGEVTALAGAMSMNDAAIIGIALGSSEAAGYVTPDGALEHWLNELAFVPIDNRPDAPADEWSGDLGCGVQYLSQQAVGRLIPASGLPVDDALGLPEKLKVVQQAMAGGDLRAHAIYETIGVYLGYALAHYADYYTFRNALILGRVTSGEGGAVILEQAREVLRREFPELAATNLQLPDESNRRVGQAIAAASLPATE